MRGGWDGSRDHHRTRRKLNLISEDAAPARNIALKLGVIARQMRMRFDREVGDLGVTRSQWMVVVVVARTPGATQRTIAEALEMTEAAAGRLIDRLCLDGMLERRPKPDDRRAHCVFLKPAAEPILRKLGKVGEHNEAVAFAGFDQDELNQLNRLLDRVYANVASTPR